MPLDSYDLKTSKLIQRLFLLEWVLLALFLSSIPMVKLGVQSGIVTVLYSLIIFYSIWGLLIGLLVFISWDVIPPKLKRSAGVHGVLIVLGWAYVIAYM